jgi:hypothetical protein
MTVIAVTSVAMSAVWMVARRGDPPLLERLVVPPGHDPSILPIATEGAHLIEIDPTGALLVHTNARVRRQEKPHAFQDIDGGRREVSVRFDIAPTGDPRLVVGSYDSAFPLVIEPQTGKD